MSFVQPTSAASPDAVALSSLPPVSQTVLDWLASQQQAMTELLAQIVNIDSGSGHEDGTRAVAAVLRARLESAGIAVQTLPEPGWGDCLLARVPGSDAAATGHLQLMGHMDTVFPLGTAAARPWRVEDGKA